MMRVEIKVLGSLRAVVDGVSFVPTASKVRQVLAILALNAGNVVTVSSMTEELWGARPPRSVTTTLHTYISHLRRNLDSVLPNRRCSSKEILVTEYVGYLLNIDATDVDAGEYDKLSAAGRQAMDDGDYATAARTLRAALSLWRGPVLADVQTRTRLVIEAIRLEESRLSDLELCIDADLRCGRHHRLLGELAVLCVQHPMLESFHAQYMLALYRSNRRWRALEVYQQLRTTMVDEIGVDTSPRLRRLHQEILAGEPWLDSPVMADGAMRPAVVVR